ncbi:MAG: MFS transporter [Bowdeniella nasicola]|nr:MFS transporter [Bowdeniella nasicola]
MANPYAQILSRPGARAFSATGLIARLPMSITGLGVILMVEAYYGSYALAGAVSATFVVTMAALAPFLARLIDRYGQARIMRPAIAIYNLGLAALIIAAVRHAPAFVLFAAAMLAGACTGSIGALVRARWAVTVRDARELHTAYALESALDEVVFVIGPMLTTMLATVVAPPSGVLVAIACSLIGGYWFLSLRDSEPAPQLVSTRRTRWRARLAGRTHPDAILDSLWADADDAPLREPAPDLRAARVADIPVLRLPAMHALIVVMVCVGVLFGGSDIATVAFSAEQGRDAAAGVILGIFAFGSLISGLIYGARAWRTSLQVRLAVGVSALAGGSCLFLFITSLPLLASVMFVTGFAIAPTFINVNAVIQEIVHPSRLTEGLTWASTASSAGFSLGSTIAGSVVDRFGGHAGFVVVICGAGLATILVLATLPIITRSLPENHEPSLTVS